MIIIKSLLIAVKQLEIIIGLILIQQQLIKLHYKRNKFPGQVINEERKTTLDWILIWRFGLQEVV